MLIDIPGVYEVRFLPASDRDRLPLLFATDDQSAIELACLARDYREMEVWCGCRLVACYPARPVPDGISPSSGALPTIVSPLSLDLH